jgi:hypothetical protein
MYLSDIRDPPEKRLRTEKKESALVEPDQSGRPQRIPLSLKGKQTMAEGSAFRMPGHHTLRARQTFVKA